MHIEVWLERERENRAEERLKSINQKEIAKRKNDDGKKKHIKEVV
jgi:hypothetical protein